jgi:hypothetical protein
VRFGVTPARVSAEDYDAIHARWTRHVRITRGISANRELGEVDTALDARVTLLAPEVRAAYVAKMAAMRSFTEEERARLAGEQHDEEEKFVDFVLLAQTGRWDWNDFSAPRSVWTITVVDDKGRERGQPEIQPMPLKADVLAQLFPEVTPFSRAWRVRFPRTPEAPLYDASTRAIALRIAGPLGHAEALWKARPQ